MSLLTDAREMHDELRAFRRAMHTEPEIGLDLPRTQERVLAALDPLGLELSTGSATTSVTGVLRGGGANPSKQRPTVLLRADMDALPVQELVDVDYRSHIDGAMHACGHDLHTAMLVGAARLLAARRGELPGDVVLMFQPGEEGFGGGKIMVEEGVLEAAGRRVDAAYGMHVFSALEPYGRFATKPGTMLAASDALAVTFRGKGGHGSSPHGAKDPVPAAAELITALQTTVTREFSIFDPIVVTVGVLRAGTKRNVIPDEAYVEATVRTFSPEAQAKAAEVLPRVARGIAAARGLEVSAEYHAEYPITANTPAEADFSRSVVEELFGDVERHHRWVDPIAGSEDFSFVLREVPGSFLGLGAVPPGLDPMATEFNHSPRAYFDDGVLADGAAVYAELAVRKLEALAAPDSGES
ncbi:MAG: amidohydrolase [Austwickia sp.]|jgi:amidohydrolase|nr:MAG: amidohydrolase [Austwickia sp.]